MTDSAEEFNAGLCSGCVRGNYNCPLPGTGNLPVSKSLVRTH